jgi:hypothetical protein
MLTDFQRTKLSRIFRLYDDDEDGFIARTDYERAARNVAAVNGHAAGSPGYLSVFSSYMAGWEGLRRMADQDQDGRVSLAEHLAGYDRLLGGAGPGVLLAIADAATALIDQDKDGRMSRREYVDNLVAWGSGAIGAPAAIEAFGKLDHDGDGYVTRDEMTEIVRDFFTGDDPNARGTWLVGPLT